MKKPVELERRTLMHGITPTAVYRVETEIHRPVFMRVDRSNYMNRERAVLIVDAGRFLKAWKADSGPARASRLLRLAYSMRRWFGGAGRAEWLPHLSKSAWISDYKFRDAQDGFSRCSESPVPLARVGLSFPPGAVGFSNGISRTLWLLVHEATAFPVECATNEADELQHLVGVDWASWQTVDELTREHGPSI